MKRLLLIAACLSLIGILVACKQDSSATPSAAEPTEQDVAVSTIAGTVSYRERIALSPNAVLKVQLQDVSRADAPATVIASQTISPAGQIPIAFELEFNPQDIDQRMSYSLGIRIEDGEQLLFINDTHIPVLTRGGGNSVDVMLRAASSQSNAAANDSAAQDESLTGQFTYLADAARFLDCRSGKSFPVAMEGAYRELESTYLNSSVEPGDPLLVEVSGKFLERPGMEEGTRLVHFIVDEFKGIAMESDCSPNRQASLENTRWKLVELADGRSVDSDATVQEPLLTLRSGENQAGGSGGCNNFFGSYSTSGDNLSFGVLGNTMKACPFGMEIEQAFLQALGETTRYSISGEFLTLFAGDKAVAKLEAIYL